MSDEIGERKVDLLLRDVREGAGDVRLPRSFASEVARQAREIHELARRQWKALLIVSAMTILLISWFSWKLGDRERQETLPPSGLFRPQLESAAVSPSTR